MKPVPPLQAWMVILLIGVVIVAVFMGIAQNKIRNEEQKKSVDKTVPVFLNVETCTAAGGSWNEAGLLANCECNSTKQCPYGLTCESSNDERSVCINM